MTRAGSTTGPFLFPKNHFLLWLFKPYKTMYTCLNDTYENDKPFYLAICCINLPFSM
jgi:hypothetical protein